MEKDFNRQPKNVLLSTLAYLHVENQDQFLKASNITSLICRIQNLLPDECSICHNTYCFKIDDIPLLACVFCGQEVHRKCYLHLIGSTNPDCDADSFQKAYNPLNIPGLHYSCKPCELLKIPQEDSGKKKRFTTKRKDQSTSSQTLPPSTQDSVISQESTSTWALPNSDSSNGAASFEHILNPTINPDVERIYPNLDNINLSNTIGSNPTEEIDSHPTASKTQVTNSTESDSSNAKQKNCRFYMKGSCKYGMKGNGLSF